MSDSSVNAAVDIIETTGTAFVAAVQAIEDRIDRILSPIEEQQLASLQYAQSSGMITAEEYDVCVSGAPCVLSIDRATTTAAVPDKKNEALQQFFQDYANETAGLGGTRLSTDPADAVRDSATEVTPSWRDDLRVWGYGVLPRTTVEGLLGDGSSMGLVDLMGPVGLGLDANEITASIDQNWNDGNTFMAAGELGMAVLGIMPAGRGAERGASGFRSWSQQVDNEAGILRGIDDDFEHLFRGTTREYNGRPTDIATPTSTDPLVAGHYCVANRCTHGGVGEVLVFDRSSLGNIVTDNPYALRGDLERVLDGVNAEQARELSSFSLTESQTRTILGEMGYSLPQRAGLSNLTTDLTHLRDTNVTPLSRSQVQDFVRRAREIRGR